MQLTTEQKLMDKYGKLTLTMKEMANEISMDYLSLLNAISAERFPIPTVKGTKIRIAKVSDVANFIDGHLDK